MDRQTQEHLRRITASAPKHIRDNIYKEVKTSPDLANLARDRVNDKRTDPRIRAKIQEGIDRGVYDKATYETNERKASQMDAYVNQKIDEGMRSGKLKPTDDKFTRKMQRKMR